MDQKILFKMLERINTPILVTGAERSGSTVIAKIIELGGAFTGNINSRYENMGIKEVTNNYLHSIGINPKNQYPLPSLDNISIPADWKERVLHIVRSNGYSSNRSWMFKSSRACQLFPIWHYAFPDAKWIIVRRRTGDIIQSCTQTAFMHSYSNLEVLKQIGVENEKEGWKWWVHKHNEYFIRMMEEGLNCKVIWPERMVEGDYSQIYEMLEWLGLKWSSEIVKQIDPLLNKNRR